MLNISKYSTNLNNLKTPQDIGREFEKNIQRNLKLTKLDVYSEKDIKAAFGKNNSAIDHMIITDSFNICFQDKWMSTKPILSSINHFIQCVSNISRLSSKKCYGIYLSNMPLTDDAMKAFTAENSINNNLYFISIDDKDQELLINKLFNFLYSLEIFIYDDDNACLMLE
jgi:hypothetical protein